MTFELPEMFITTVDSLVNRALLRSVNVALEALTSLRKFHVSLFSSLSKNELERFGIHQERGKETVEFMIRLVSGHDVNHLVQIEALRKKYLSE